MRCVYTRNLLRGSTPQNLLGVLEEVRIRESEMTEGPVARVVMAREGVAT